MPNYVIGDVQGCYRSLMTLLDKLAFNEKNDQLWLAGDLVNRGPDSLSVLRFLSRLPKAPIVTLGNHDLHCLSVFHGVRKPGLKDTLNHLFSAPDADDLCCWLRFQRMAYFDPNFNCLMVHAGVYSSWSLSETLAYANELELQLQGNQASDLLLVLFGDTPTVWSDSLPEPERWRFIVNVLTRMRFCYPDGRLEFQYKGTIENAPSGLKPWFERSGKVWPKHEIAFGHWAALEGKVPYSGLWPVDTGCVWGRQLSALRLEDKQWFHVENQEESR